MRSSLGILNPEGRSNGGPAPAMPSGPITPPEIAATPSAPVASENNLYLYSVAAFQELIPSVLELENQIAGAAAAPAPKEPVQLPESPLDLRARALAVYAGRDWAAADSLFRTVLRHFPGDLAIWQARLVCARRQKHHTHARLILDDALRQHAEWRGILGAEEGGGASRAAAARAAATKAVGLN